MRRRGSCCAIERHFALAFSPGRRCGPHVSLRCMCKLPNSQARPFTPSLRAKRSNPAFVRQQERSWIASSHSLLAMTVLLRKHRSPSRRECARGVEETLAPVRGRGECRMRAAPAVPCAKWVMKNAHEHTGSAENIRHSLRNGFTAYSALSLATNSSCHHRQTNYGFVRARLSRRTSANLTSATDAGTTRLHRTLQRRSSARRSIAHGSKPALRFTCAPDAAASTASNPASVTIAIRPSLWDQTAGDIEVIWVWREGICFCKRDWTGQIMLNSFKKLAQPRNTPTLIRQASLEGYPRPARA